VSGDSRDTPGNSYSQDFLVTGASRHRERPGRVLLCFFSSLAFGFSFLLAILSPSAVGPPALPPAGIGKAAVGSSGLPIAIAKLVRR
jgi:hypothetical protein